MDLTRLEIDNLSENEALNIQEDCVNSLIERLNSFRINNPKADLSKQNELIEKLNIVKSKFMLVHFNNRYLLKLLKETLKEKFEIELKLIEACKDIEDMKSKLASFERQEINI